MRKVRGQSQHTKRTGGHLSTDIISSLAPFLLFVLGQLPISPVYPRQWRTVEMYSSRAPLTAEQRVQWEHAWSQKQCKMNYVTLQTRIFLCLGLPIRSQWLRLETSSENTID